MNKHSSFAVVLAAASLSFLFVDESSAQTTPSTGSRSASALSVRSTKEVQNISALINALRAYASIYDGKYPASIDALVQKNILSADEFKKLTTSPFANSSLPGDGYLFFQKGKDLKSPLDAVLVIGKNTLGPSDLRRAVGLQGGSVTWWKRSEIDIFLKNNPQAK